MVLRCRSTVQRRAVLGAEPSRAELQSRAAIKASRPYRCMDVAGGKGIWGGGRLKCNDDGDADGKGEGSPACC